MSEDKYRAALDAAAKQLSCRALSTKMLRGKLLAKGHDEEATDYALAWLTERSLLSDGQFAESVVRSYARRGYGAARIRQELSRRGISREDADAAMELFSPALPQMLSLLEKRLHGDPPPGHNGRRPATRLFVGRHQKRSRGIRRISRHRRIIFTPSAHTFVRKG